jgi:hypothetical protein
MKKNNEVFDFKCQVFFVSTQVGVVGRKRKTKKEVDTQPTEPLAKRVRPDPTHPPRVTRSARQFPSEIA